MLKQIPLLLGYDTTRFGKKKNQTCYIIQVQEKRNISCLPTEISRLVRVSEGQLGKAGIT